MAIDWGRMAMGIGTGYLGAKIANTEANDKMNADIHKAAGVNYHTNTLPDWQKKERVREREFKQVAEFFGSDDAANYFGDRGAITGEGNSLDVILNTLKAKKLDPNQFKKDFKWEGSTYEERYQNRFLDIQDAGRIATGLSTGSSKIGPMTVQSQLEGLGTGTGTGVAADTGVEPVGGMLPGGEKELSITQATKPEIAKKYGLSDMFGATVDARGVETKFNAISKAVNELGGYGNSIRLADGTTEFRIADEMRTTSNAHIAIAEYFSQNRPDINQLDAATLGQQELNKQTITPFQILASNLKTEYKQGDAGTPATLALGGETIDANTTMIGDKSIRQFIESIYNTELLDDGYGNVNSSVFAKFVENIPNNFVINKGTENEEKLSDVLKNAHALSIYYKV